MDGCQDSARARRPDAHPTLFVLLIRRFKIYGCAREGFELPSARSVAGWKAETRGTLVKAAQVRKLDRQSRESLGT
jgi:hypothetical protein